MVNTSVILHLNNLNNQETSIGQQTVFSIGMQTLDICHFGAFKADYAVLACVIVEGLMVPNDYFLVFSLL